MALSSRDLAATPSCTPAAIPEPKPDFFFFFGGMYLYRALRGCVLYAYCLNNMTAHAFIGSVWERVPYISDIGLVRNFSKTPFNSTTEMPSLQQLQGGYYPAFDPAPAGVGSVVSPFRRVRNNFLISNYNAGSGVWLDDAGSRFLVSPP